MPVHNPVAHLVERALREYSPDQPRDESGRWTGDGGGAYQRGEVVYHPGPKIRTWGGWYQHTKISHPEHGHIGTLQTSRRGGRTEHTTLSRDGQSAVRGHDVDWLMRQARTGDEQQRREKWLRAMGFAAKSGAKMDPEDV